MPIHVTATEEFCVGQELVLEGPAPAGSLCAVFEDDGDTGYFYALDTSSRAQAIQDALHIYDVQNISGRDQPSVAKIGWSADHQKVVLLIHGLAHAVFDFTARQGYCRTGFPPASPDAGWSTRGHDWDDAVVALFQ